MLNHSMCRLSFQIFVVLWLSAAGSIFAAGGQADAYLITFPADKQTVTPTVAAVGEDVSFRFAFYFTDKSTGQEAKPLGVKSVHYKLTSSAAAIQKCVPNMSIVNGLSAELWKTDVNKDVPEGDDHVIGDSDNPAVGFTGNDMGHSFWKIEITPPIPGITDKNVWLTLLHWQPAANTPYGFYPRNGKKWIAAFSGVGGIIKDDSQTILNKRVVSKSYLVKIDRAEKVIDATIALVSGHIYHWGDVEKEGKNCTGQAVHVGKDVAECDTPDGIGTVVWRKEPGENGLQPFRPITSQPFPNPYHHAKQLSEQ